MISTFSSTTGWTASMVTPRASESCCGEKLASRERADSAIAMLSDVIRASTMMEAGQTSVSMSSGETPSRVLARAIV